MFRRKMPADFVEKIPESLQQVALAVPPIDDNFDPDATPETGEQYLQQVIFERTRRVPEVVYNHHDRPPDKCGVTWDSSSGAPIDTTTPESLLPTNEWCSIQCDTFRRIQRRISSIRLSRRFPYNLPSLPSDWLAFCSTQAPYLRCMIQISQARLEELLHVFVEWHLSRRAQLADVWLPQWIYATLACLHQPLEPSIHHCLRQVARICIEERNSLSPDCINQVNPLNLIVCIIAKVFGQVDLLHL
ncbi:protein Gemin2 [Phlebotomus argentipes]|uniref:protein Gemin2 n=1 Tax=Phlebotomus argentipes TaxID=94469 RepID=UPI0028935E54|nr:protein Gemin2 [Phlebotomus argentipes]